MEIKLKNIGMIKEANVLIDGLTVIAGENDTGKSTVGKALFMIFYYLKTLQNYKALEENNEKVDNKLLDENNMLDLSINALTITKLVFDNEIENATINLKNKEDILTLTINENGISLKEDGSSFSYEALYLPIFIETPIIWNLNKFFNSLSNIESLLSNFGKNIKINYPFTLKDLHFNLNIENNENNEDLKKIRETIIEIIKGEFKKDNSGNYFFKKDNKNISLLNTATGIKAFGIFQVLLDNNYLTKNTLLILDEPEVHLHPKWQLKMAEVIVELVKNGVKVVVNSHSPYIIEALKRYSDLNKIEDKTNFYLAEDGYIQKVEENNSLTLEKIFNKLSEPFDVFDKMDSEKIQNG